MSTIAVDNVRPSLGGTSAPLVEAVAKVYAQFDMNASPLTVNNSLNTSSVTDRATGKSTTNFTNALADALQPEAFCVGQNNNGAAIGLYGRVEDNTVTPTSLLTPTIWADTATLRDPDRCSHTAWGDLA